MTLRTPGAAGVWVLAVTHILVNDALNLHRLHNVRDELGVCVRVSDLLMQQGTDTALQHTHTHELHYSGR